MLVAAGYLEWDLKVQLAFDRAIDIAGLDGTQVTLDDGIINGQRYRATGAATLLDPTTVEIGLVAIAVIGAGDIVLDATAASGIVAVDDGGTWAGATDLILPFP